MNKLTTLPTARRALQLIAAALLLSQSYAAMADSQTDCADAAGTYLTGRVVSGAKFASARTALKGIRLTHTHVQIQSDQDGHVYDVAMDNVFASDYVRNASTMPRSLAAIRAGDHLQLCGEPYSSGYGIHWVHTNCSATPDPSHPDGSVKEVAVNGTVSRNLESSQAYCYLWN